MGSRIFSFNSREKLEGKFGFWLKHMQNNVHENTLRWYNRSMSRKNERTKKIKKDAADTNYIQTYAFDLPDVLFNHGFERIG